MNLKTSSTFMKRISACFIISSLLVLTACGGNKEDEPMQETQISEETTSSSKVVLKEQAPLNTEMDNTSENYTTSDLEKSIDNLMDYLNLD